jgi:2-oxoglutarate ferredoxin oxidoreductase subunit gamma
MPTHQAILSGAGGQGLMFIGKLLANLAVDHYPHVTFMPSYGAEVRGGTSNCQIILSDETIATPMVEVADAEVLMNQPSVERFLPRLAPDGAAFINSSMASAEHDNAVLIPATEIALDAGDVQAANVVLLGAYIRRTEVLDHDEALEGVTRVSKPKGRRVVEINRRAFETGYTYLSR